MKIFILIKSSKKVKINIIKSFTQLNYLLKKEKLILYLI